MKNYLKFLSMLDLPAIYGTERPFSVIIADCYKEKIEVQNNGQIIVRYMKGNLAEVVPQVKDAELDVIAIFSDEPEDRISQSIEDMIAEVTLAARRLLMPFSLGGDKTDIAADEVYTFDIYGFLTDQWCSHKSTTGYTLTVTSVSNVGRFKFSPMVNFIVYRKNRPRDHDIYSLPIHEFLSFIKTKPVPDVGACYNFPLL